MRKIEQQQTTVVTVGLITKQISKLPSWKSLGPDGLLGYWLKNIKSTRQKPAEFYNVCLQNDTVSTWMIRAQTTLMMKDKNRGADASKYRPRTCLPLSWKL